MRCNLLADVASNDWGFDVLPECQRASVSRVGQSGQEFLKSVGCQSPESYGSSPCTTSLQIVKLVLRLEPPPPLQEILKPQPIRVKLAGLFQPRVLRPKHRKVQL